VTAHIGSVHLLRSAGLRVTAPRIAVLDVIPPGSHLDADAVAQLARKRLGRVSTQAVYDVLHALTGAGLLRRIEPAGSSARYERRVGDNHHHLVCRSCGDVADVDCAVGPAPCLIPVDNGGFLVDEAEVVYWGLCPSCRELPGSRTATPEEHSP
jgi:Fe2+ or Zn2+ uptake regulation protein